MLRGRREAVARELGAGLVAGMLAVSVAVSVATLVFSGPLAQFQLLGLGMALSTAVIIAVAQSLSSGFPAAVALPQERTAPILALMAASVAATMEQASSEQLLSLVITVLVTSTLITGASLYLIGRFRLGGLIRYFPFPVTGGVLAGTGLMLVLGGMEVMAGSGIGLERWRELWTPPMLGRWLPGVVLAVLLICARRTGRLWLLPTLLIAGFVVFHAVLWLLGVAFGDAQRQGWLLGPFAQVGVPLPGLELPGLLLGADWRLGMDQLERIPVLLLVTAVSVLLNASALELEAGHDVNLNRELRSTGMANVMSALGGGMVGFQSLSVSRLARELGARGALTGFVVAAVAALVLAMGTPVLSAVPKPLVGGVLLYLGLSFLVDWLWDGWRQLPRGDYLIVVMILVVVGTLGFLPGVGIGLLAAVVLFAYQYSQVNVIRLAGSGAIQHSNVERTPAQKQLLRERGESIQVLRLQGFLFFGTTHRIYRQVRSRCGEREPSAVRYVILDFEAVSGLDSSAAISFQKLIQYARRNELELISSALSSHLAARLEKAGSGLTGAAVRGFADLDHGLEWCENQLLEEARKLKLIEPSFEGWRQDAALLRLMATGAMRRFFDLHHLARGEYLVRQGEDADKLYILESGQVTAWLTMPGGRRLRLRTMSAGNILGEIGWYLSASRSASVIADSDSVVLSLTRGSLERMEREAPGLAMVFHAHVATLLAERLFETDRTLQAILE